jgi:7-cyano-7-deazaguanine reductase
MTTKPSKALQTFPNPAAERDYHIHMQVPEFTCLCPLTGQPDFARFDIDIIPDKLCVELKSLKLYMWSYRDEGAFHEKVTNTILDDLVQAIAPRFLRVTARWYVRGGIYTNVVVEHRQPGWTPAPRVDLAQFDAAQPTAG